jgi:hypothetical protein
MILSLVFSRRVAAPLTPGNSICSVCESDEEAGASHRGAALDRHDANQTVGATIVAAARTKQKKAIRRTLYRTFTQTRRSGSGSSRASRKWSDRDCRAISMTGWAETRGTRIR